MPTSSDDFKTREELVAELHALRAESAADTTQSAARLHESQRAGAHSDTARDVAIASGKSKDHFLATLSHELRTPLNPVLLLATIGESNPGLSLEAREAFATIRRNVELQLSLIDDLYDLTAITNGKLRLRREHVRAHPLLKTTAEICASEIQKKHIEVRWELNAANDHLSADGGRLAQIYWNLIRNAVKFTPEGGRIILRTQNDPGGRLVVQVSDSGIGMDAAAITHIFEAFDQGAAVASELGGLGLGLAISKAVVDLHDGRIRADSQGRGRGSTFTVTMNTVPAEVAATVMEPTAVTGNSRRLRILLVDDHADTTVVMGRLLGFDGHTVKSAATAAAAVSLAETETFDVLISDIGLPDASGLDLMRELRQCFGLKGIALSGYGRDEDIQKSLAAGFAGHLTKPVNLIQLQALMAAIA